MLHIYVNLIGSHCKYTMYVCMYVCIVMVYQRLRYRVYSYWYRLFIILSGNDVFYNQQLSST